MEIKRTTGRFWENNVNEISCGGEVWTGWPPGCKPESIDYSLEAHKYVTVFPPPHIFDIVWVWTYIISKPVYENHLTLEPVTEKNMMCINFEPIIEGNGCSWIRKIQVKFHNKDKNDGKHSLTCYVKHGSSLLLIIEPNSRTSVWVLNSKVLFDWKFCLLWPSTQVKVVSIAILEGLKATLPPIASTGS